MDLSFFSNLFGDTSDPIRASQIRGGLIGAGQAIAQPYGNFGTGLIGAATGAQAGQDRYIQQQANRLGLADGQLGLQQKLGQANFLRQIQGQPALTLDDVMKGNFGSTTPSAPLSTPAAIASAPQAPTQQIAPTPATNPAAQSPFDTGTFYKNFIAPHEGGYTASDGNGAPANYGINQKANPDVNVATLTPDSAQQILTDRYFKPSGATSMQGPIAAIQADTAMNMGKGAAAQLLAQSGGDPQKYLDLREQRYRAIAANDPTKAANLPGWLKRNNDLRQYVAQNQQQATPAAAAAASPVATPQAAPTSQGIIPDDLRRNPLFMAAVQSGDSATVMQMLQKHQIELTPQELADHHLPPDTIAYHAPDGTIDIKKKSDLKSPEVIAQEKDARLLSPAEVAQKEDISRTEAQAKRDAVVAAIDPSYIDNQAKAIATYRAKPSAMSLRYPEISSAIMSKVYALNPNYDDRKYNGANATVTAFDKGKQGDQTRAFNTAIAHINTLVPLVNALNNGDVKAINSISNYIKTQFGLSTAPTTVQAVKSIVGDELVKAVVGGAGALGDREGVQVTMDKANSPKLILDVLDKYKDLMGGQLVSLEKQYSSSTGLKDFNEKLLPETIKELENRGNKPSAAAPAFKASDLPANARMQLKANVVTTFKNGSKWTLQNGQPVQVQ